MKHAEVIFETGAKSVLSYDDEQEVLDFVKNHTDRAKAGQPGSAQDWSHRIDLPEDEIVEHHNMATRVATRPAERVSKVLLYDDHPGNLNDDCCLTTEQVQQVVSALENDGKVNVHDLYNALRKELDPMIMGEVGPHDSQYKMDHVKELDISAVA